MAVSPNAFPCGYDSYQYNMSDATEKTWDDVKDTWSGKLARLVYAGGLFAVVLSTLIAVAALVAEYAFGVEDTSFWLVIAAMFVIAITGTVLSKMWPAFRLRKESFQD